MDIRQCTRCSKLFQYRGNGHCPACVQELDEVFLNVRNYLDDNPRAGVEDVCAACEADEDDVLRWLREGRLLLTKVIHPLLICQLCQTHIRAGRYCEICAAKVVGQLENTARHFGRCMEKRDVRSHVQISK